MEECADGGAEEEVADGAGALGELWLTLGLWLALRLWEDEELPATAADGFDPSLEHPATASTTAVPSTPTTRIAHPLTSDTAMLTGVPRRHPRTPQNSETVEQ